MKLVVLLLGLPALVLGLAAAALAQTYTIVDVPMLAEHGPSASTTAEMSPVIFAGMSVGIVRIIRRVGLCESSMGI